MASNDIFIIHPTEEQAVALKAFVKALKINFEMTTPDEIYNPAFVAKIRKSRHQIKQGKSVRVEKAELKSFLGLE